MIKATASMDGMFGLLNQIKTPVYKLKTLGDIRTPPELVDEILDHLPESIWAKGRMFLDPCCGRGTFLLKIIDRLIKYHSVESILKMIKGIDIDSNCAYYSKKALAIRLGVSEEEIPVERCDFLTWEPNMKFDVIVGNPPYQDPAGQNTLYPKFYAKCVPLLADGGYISLITPPAIIPGLWGVRNPDGIKMPKPKQIIFIKDGIEVKKHFPGIGSDFCYFIIQNTVNVDNSSVAIETDAGKSIALGPLFIRKLPAGANIDVAQSILSKCFKYGSDKYSATSGDYRRCAITDPSGTHKAVEAITSSGEVKTRNVRVVKEHPHLGSPKVIMAMYGKSAVIDYSHMLVSAAQEKINGVSYKGHNIITILTESDIASESVMSLLNSRLQRFFNFVINETRCPYVAFIKNFVMVPLTKVYADSELETIVGINAAEIQFLKEFFNAVN